MFSNDCNAAGGRSQKICSARILHARQLSMMSRPYGVSTLTPCTALGTSVSGGRTLRAERASGDRGLRLPVLFACAFRDVSAVTSRGDAGRSCTEAADCGFRAWLSGCGIRDSAPDTLQRNTSTAHATSTYVTMACDV